MDYFSLVCLSCVRTQFTLIYVNQLNVKKKKYIFPGGSVAFEK